LTIFRARRIAAAKYEKKGKRNIYGKCSENAVGAANDLRMEFKNR